MKIYVLAVISGCDNAPDWDPLALDDVQVFTEPEKAKEMLKRYYEDRMDKDFGKFDESQCYLHEWNFSVVLHDDEHTTTYYQGEIREFEI